ncbi:MAG: cadherin-like domain-containing protein [Elainellaceae cyanobacterium]
MFRLNLRSSGRLDLQLSRLRANANLEIYEFKRPKRKVLKDIGKTDFSDLSRREIRRNLKLLGRSRKGGKRNEKISETLESGIYYIRVFTPRPRDNTRYRLRVKANPNTSPVLITNRGASLPTGTQALISGNLLKTVDLEQSSRELFYTLTRLPTDGILQFDSTPLRIGDQFTQADINAGRLSYFNNTIVEQLTNNQTRDLAAGISGSNVVWNSFLTTGGSSEITSFDPSQESSSQVFFYNGTTSTVTAVTDGSQLDLAADISGSKIVWNQSFSFLGIPSPEIYFFDTNTRNTTHLTPGTFSLGLAPVISDSHIAWSGIVGTTTQPILYNIATGQRTQLANDNTSRAVVDISGSSILWNTITAGPNGSTLPQEVFFYNGLTGASIQLSNGNGNNSAAAISDSLVIWNQYDGNDYEVFAYEIATGMTRQLSNNDVDDVVPIGGLSGSNAIWNRINENGKAQVFFYDGTTSRPLTDIGSNRVGLGVSGGNVVYNSLDNNGSPDDIFFFDTQSNRLVQITNDNRANFAVGISGSKVVWNGYDGTDFEVFFADLDQRVSQDHFAFTVSDGLGGITSGSFNLTTL